METRTVKLGDLSSDLKGQYGINASAVPLRTTLPTYLRITDIDDFGRIKHDGLCSVETDELNKYSLREGDLVFARTGNSTGRNYWYDSHDGSFVFAGFLIRFHFEETEELVPRFLKYYVQSTEYYDWIEGFSTGSTRKNLNARDYGNLPVVLPPKAYQQKVVAILDMIENKILLNQQINKNLLRLCRIQFNRVKLACSSTTDLSNIAVLMMGQSPKGNTYNQKGEGTPLLNGAADFRGGINPSKYTSDPKKVTKPGDYVFGVRATIGLTTKVFGRYAIGRGTGLARSLKPEYDELLYFILEDSFDYFSHAATGSVYPNVSRKDFETYSSPAFSDNSQRVFHSFAAPLMEKIYQDETQNKKLTQIRDILLPKLLSGSVDLSGIEEAMKNA